MTLATCFVSDQTHASDRQVLEGDNERVAEDVGRRVGEAPRGRLLVHVDLQAQEAGAQDRKERR